MAKEKDEHSRRDFLTRAGQLTAGACGLAVTAGAVRMAVPELGSGDSRFSLGMASDFKMGTLTWVREKDLFVMRDESGTGAFSAVCTHLGCTVRRTGEGFLCPCHGAAYGANGEVVKGPARKPLPWYRLWIEPDGRLWVDVAQPQEERGPVTLALPGMGKR